MNKTRIPLGTALVGYIIPEIKCKTCNIRMYFEVGFRFVVFHSDGHVSLKEKGFVCYKCGAVKVK